MGEGEGQKGRLHCSILTVRAYIPQMETSRDIGRLNKC